MHGTEVHPDASAAARLLRRREPFAFSGVDERHPVAIVLAMKLLPETFRKYGYNFRQLQREGDVALFEKTSGTVVAYEVVIVQRHEDYMMAGNLIPAAEAMPGNETWGLKGWSPRTLSEAMRKFGEVCAAQEDRVMEQALKNLGSAA